MTPDNYSAVAKKALDELFEAGGPARDARRIRCRSPPIRCVAIDWGGAMVWTILPSADRTLVPGQSLCYPQRLLVHHPALFDRD